MNVALHDMEEAAGVRYWEGGTLRAAPGTPVLVRYADDVLALCHTREQAEHVEQRLARWLEPRGLVFNEAKTVSPTSIREWTSWASRSAATAGSC